MKFTTSNPHPPPPVHHPDSQGQISFEISSNLINIVRVKSHFFLGFSILILVAGPPSSVQAESFKGGGIGFESPKNWVAQKTTSAMRKAQFMVKGKQGGTAEVVFFYFGPGGAGGVDANVNRWLGQFKEPPSKLNSKTDWSKIGGIKVTYVSAEGTFLKGPPFGQKVPVPGSAMIGAIVEGKMGMVFIKTTGAKPTVTGITQDLKAMVAKALQPKPDEP